MKKNKVDKFEIYYGYLKQLHAQGDSLDIKSADKLRINPDSSVSIVKLKTSYKDRKQVIVNSSEYYDSNLVSIGKWLQNHESKFTEKQRKLLKDIGYEFMDETENLFEKYFRYLKQLKGQGDDTNVKSADKLKRNPDNSVSIVKKQYRKQDDKIIHYNKEEYYNKNLLSIGQWFYRNASKFTEEQKQQLRDIGYHFVDEEESLFEKYYGFLKQLKIQGDSTDIKPDDKLKIYPDGHVSIIKRKTKRSDRKLITINEKEYNDKNLVSIGHWFNIHESKFSENEKRLLRDIGYRFVGEYNIKFELYYNYLKQLQAQGDSTDIKSADKLKINPDGSVSIIKKQVKKKNGKIIFSNEDEYNDIDLLAMGHWLHVNEDKFTEIQKQQLRDIGYKLREDTNKDYDNVNSNFEKNSHLTNVTHKLKQKNSKKEDIETLKKLGYDPNKLDNNDYIFYICYGYLKQLKAQGKSTDIKETDKIRIDKNGNILVIKKQTVLKDGKPIIINLEEYNNYDNILLGKRLYKNYSNFTSSQQKQLSDIGYHIGSNFEKKFDIYYGYLKQLKAQGDSPNIKTSDKIKKNSDDSIMIIKKRSKLIDGKIVIINDKEYNDNDLVSIGQWLYNNEPRFTDDQKQQLRDIGYKLREDRQNNYIEASSSFEKNSHITNVKKNLVDKKEKNNGRKI